MPFPVIQPMSTLAMPATVWPLPARLRVAAANWSWKGKATMPSQVIVDAAVGGAISTAIAR